MTLFSFNVFGFHIAPSFYGLMYAVGFLCGYYYFLQKKIVEKKDLEDLFFYVFLGVIGGGRIGYILFYNLSYYLQNPLSMIKVWEGGMSFHGGFLGVVLATYIFSQKKHINFWKIIDELAVIVCIGLGAGRLGNLFNHELLGYPHYQGPFAVIKGGISYFPSPLLEAFLEGFVMLVCLSIVNKYKKFYGQTSAFFLILYGTFRSIVEYFFRMPDPQIGYIYGYFTLGMLLSIPMIIGGIILYFILQKNENNRK